MKRLAFSFLAVALLACSPIDFPPPKPAPTGDDFADACANMRRLEHSAGDDDCEETLAGIEATGIVSMEPKCLVAAESRAQVDACFEDEEE